LQEWIFANHKYVSADPEKNVVNELKDHGIQFIGGRSTRELVIRILLYCDDMALLAKSQQSITHMMNVLERVTQKYGMQISIKKTKLMLIGSGDAAMIELRSKVKT